MKKALISGLLCVGAATGLLFACDKDDDIDDIKDVNPTFVQALKEMYPEASRVEWEHKGRYTVADFMNQGREVEAWFTAEAKWAMSQTDYGKDETMLPEAIYNGYYASEYSSWRIDDIDGYERPGDMFYVIEAKSGNREIDLLFDMTGNILKTQNGGDMRITPDSTF